uniref:Uncharacterized protein n=1 Tax=Arundo donax TaxID=35708 RepID=A0A0A8Z9H9_ARUDO
MIQKHKQPPFLFCFILKKIESLQDLIQCCRGSDEWFQPFRVAFSSQHRSVKGTNGRTLHR